MLKEESDGTRAGQPAVARRRRRAHDRRGRGRRRPPLRRRLHASTTASTTSSPASRLALPSDRRDRPTALVVVDKPAGWTSHDVVARLRKIYGQRRVGHAGHARSRRHRRAARRPRPGDAAAALPPGDGEGVPRRRSCSASRPTRSTPPATCSTSAPMAIDARRGRGRRAGVRRRDRAGAADGVGDEGRRAARLHELARKGDRGRAGAAPRAHRPLRRRGVRAAAPYPDATVLGRVQQRDLRALARRRPRRARSAAARTSATLRRLRVGSFELDEAHTLEAIEADPEAVVLTPVAAHARPRARRRRRRAGARDRARRRRSRRRCSPATRRRARPVRASSTPDGELLAVYERRRRGVEADRRARRRSRRPDRRWSSCTTPTRPRGRLADRRRGRDDRRVRRRAPRPPGRAAARPRARRRPRPRRRRASPSTATRPRSCGPSRRRKLLTTLEQKLELLDATGTLDECWVLHVRRGAQPGAGRGLRRARCSSSALQARLVVVGADFHFGHKRGGDVALLERMGAELGFEVLGLGLVAIDGDARRACRTRRPASASCSPTGDVAGGRAPARPAARGARRGRARRRRGRELGFPTANLAVPERIVPPGRRRLRRHASSTSDGIERPRGDLRRPPADLLRGRDRPCSRPTSSTSTATSTASRSRSASASASTARIRFDAVDALIEQLHRDVADTRRIVGPGADGGPGDQV